jgi:hypothetical protein
LIRIVNDGGKEISGLDECQIVADQINPGIILVPEPDKEAWIFLFWEFAQNSVQHRRTHFAGSPRRAAGFRESSIFGIFCHNRAAYV